MMNRNMAGQRMTAVVLALSMSMATGCATAGATQQQTAKRLAAGQLPDPRWTTFSREQEVEIGRQAAAEANKQLPVLPESHPVSRYISELGQRLAIQTPQPQWPYVFRVVNQKEINAFALPGGPIYMNVGTILAASNEAELAGVMAHEISHVYMRHGTSQASKQMAAQVPLAILGGLLGGGMGAELARLGISFGVGSVFLKYSRDAERESDQIGAYVMHQAGLDPRGMVSFFEELASQGGSRGPEFLSSHPNPGDRAVTVNETIRGLGTRSYEKDSADFRQAKAAASKLTPQSAEQIAAAQGGGQQPGGASTGGGEIVPSNVMLRMNHRAFTMSYPENWEVFGDEQSSVTIAPRAGVSQNAVAYGVIINGYQPQNGAQSLEQATDTLIRQLQQTNPGMRPVGQARTIRVNNMQARSVDLLGVSPLQQGGQQVRERDWLVTLPLRSGGILYLVFVAPEQDFDKLRPTYENMLRSLQLR